MDRFVKRAKQEMVRAKLPLDDDADVVQYTNLWTAQESAEICAELDALPEWERRRIVVAGKPCMQNRETAFYAEDPSLNYRYSGVDNTDCKPFPPVVRRVVDRVAETMRAADPERDGEIAFDFTLLNRYTDGKSDLGWHADDEKDLAPGSVIASASFGAPRDFEFRRRDDHGKKLRVPMPDGSLVVMRGTTQKTHHHRVCRNAKITRARYNITCRKIKRRAPLQ